MKTKNFTAAALMAAIMLSGCASMNNTGKGALYGGAGGTALGAGIGALAGGGKGAIIGAAIGAGVGAGAGALIGRNMDKQKAEIERIEGAKVEEVTDTNNLKALKVTFDSGILFATNQTTLSQSAMNSLSEFAQSLINNPGTDIAIYGNTDNTGSRAVNERISLQRAQAVSNFLMGRGVPSSRITDVRGLGFDSPVADNSTEAGRAANRRVDIFITAGADMIQEASR